MGCHTWFWNKWTNISKKDIKALIAYQREKPSKTRTFEEYKAFMQKFFEDCIKIRDYDTAEYLRPKINSRAHWKKDERINRYCKHITKKRISRHKLIGLLRKLDYIFYPSKYYRVPGYFDNFRIYDYDAEPWYSVQDFENYIKKNPNTNIECESDNPYEYAKNIIKRFFDEYPQGMVDLG